MYDIPFIHTSRIRESLRLEKLMETNHPDPADISGTPEGAQLPETGGTGAPDMSLPCGWSTRWLLAGRAGMDFFSSDYCCSLAKGNAPSLEPWRLSHIIPECHAALKGTVKKMTQEFVKKLMFPLIPCCPSGLVDTWAQEVVMRGGKLNHIPVAPEPVLETSSHLYLGCVFHRAEGEGKSSGRFF